MARPSLGKSPSVRLQMVITADDIRAIDDWAFANRVRSRSEAIRQLVRQSLQGSNVSEPSHPFPQEGAMYQTFDDQRFVFMDGKWIPALPALGEPRSAS